MKIGVIKEIATTSDKIAYFIAIKKATKEQIFKNALKKCKKKKLDLKIFLSLRNNGMTKINPNKHLKKTITNGCKSFDNILTITPSIAPNIATITAKVVAIIIGDFKFKKFIIFKLDKYSILKIKTNKKHLITH